MRPKWIAAALAAFITIFIYGAAYAAPAGRTPSGIPYGGMEARIDGYVGQHIGKTSPGAAVVVVKDGRIIFSKGYGYADVENNLAVDPAETVFEYASVSKLFVYVTLMRLAEEGKLDLDADIRAYLPEGFLKKLRYDEPITFMHVMNHTAGFEDYLLDLILTSKEDFPSFEEALRTCQPRQVYRPGTVSAYSNYAVALAAYIAQDIVGEPYHQYLADTVFRPLGMDSACAHPTLEDCPFLARRKAAGYYPGEEGAFKRGDWSYIPLYPAGSVNGTAEDLARFVLALMPEPGQQSPLFGRRETLDEMLSQSHAMGPGMSGFAHGFMEREGPGSGLGHGGNSACFTAQVNMVPQERFGVIVLCNAANEMQLTEGLTRMLLDTGQSGADTCGGALPGAREVQGVYIAARRAHTGFLKLHGYLALLHVEALGPDAIELRMAGQSAILKQSAPYVFERTKADGPIFEYHFDSVYFEMSQGRVKRVSGDFLPLPPGHTLPWIMADMAAAALCAAFFLLAPAVLLVRALRRRKYAPAAPQTRRERRLTFAFVLCGTGLLTNNALLILRMLIDNYRPFSQVRFHILMNYPLAALAAAIGCALILHWKRRPREAGPKAFFAVSALLLAVFAAILVKWQFFHVLS